MHRSGLAALAETYALKSDELYQVRLLFERIVDQWRIACASLGVNQLKNVSTECRVETIADFATGLGTGAIVAGIWSGNELAGLFAFDRALAHLLLDVAMGIEAGSDESGAAAFTLVEKKVLSGTFLSSGVRAFADTFGALLGEAAELVDNPNAVLELTARGERVASATMNFNLGARSGRVGGCVLFSALLPCRGRLVRNPAETQIHDRDPYATTPVTSVTVDLQAVLKNLTMPLRQIVALKPGDVLMLGKLGDKGPRLELRCAEKALYEGIVVEDQGRLRFLIEAKGKDHGTAGNPFLN